MPRARGCSGSVRPARCAATDPPDRAQLDRLGTVLNLHLDIRIAPEVRFVQAKERVYGIAFGDRFARLLGKYVREEKLLTLEEAIRKLAALPAQNLRVDRRGMLKKDYFADVVVFDPQKIQDHATYAEPHQYATGMVHVFVNGRQVLKDGEHTGAKPGRFVRGPGWTGALRSRQGGE